MIDSRGYRAKCVGMSSTTGDKSAGEEGEALSETRGQCGAGRERKGREYIGPKHRHEKTARAVKVLAQVEG
jgi:hypothetical protein